MPSVPLSAPEVRRVYRSALVAAGLPPRRFHDLRHAAVSFMLVQGVPLKVVQEVLGHSTIAVTGDIYSRVEAGMTREATERLGELLWGNL